jgi:hypothetical protein
LDIIEEREIIDACVDSQEWEKEYKLVRPQLQEIYKEISVCPAKFATTDMEESALMREKVSGHAKTIKYFAESECSEMLLEMVAGQTEDMDKIIKMEKQLNQ